MNSFTARPAPWHLWAVAILTLVWNGSGAITILLAQFGSRLDMDPSEVAYYAAQPRWFVLTTDLAVVLPIAAAVALWRRSRAAVWLFALGLAVIVANNAYDLAAGTSLALSGDDWRILTSAIASIALAQFGYAWVIRRRGVLQ